MAEGIHITSPDGKLKMTVFQKKVNEASELFYKVTYGDKPVILDSKLGLNVDNNAYWRRDFVINIINRRENNSEWKPVYGERSVIKDHYNEIELEMSKINFTDRKVRFFVRAYNEGIAFRFDFPEGPNGKSVFNITSDETQFAFPQNTQAWYTKTAQSIYEKVPLADWKLTSERPLTLRLESGLYTCLTEAEVISYVRTKFQLKQKDIIGCAIEGDVILNLPFKTPWRVIMVAEKPGKLLENNDIILNLNPPAKIAEISWIKPGKVLREMTLTVEGAKKAIDFAVAHNLQYIHFDAGWYGRETVPESDASRLMNSVDPRKRKQADTITKGYNLNLQEVLSYAEERNIGVFLYVNRIALAYQLDQILPLYKQWGIAGVKFGFVNVGSQYWTTWLHEAVKKAAANQLLVDIHDEYVPTGFSRTYPNLLTQEGIYGNEEMPTATHNATLPFTRYIAGAADYTICYYDNRIKTTHGHQLALSVVYYSPLNFLFWYDKPSSYENEPEVEFFSKVHTVWDDTKVLQGEIGEFITVARRKKDDWFIGTITNNDSRELQLSFGFLPPGKKYVATVYEDDPTAKTRTKVKVKKIIVDSFFNLKVKLMPSSGQSIWLVPQ
ncbi:MAG: glycoside hydrolase family 97 N-terminal domain-containing protein [Niabella sp.]